MGYHIMTTPVKGRGMARSFEGVKGKRGYLFGLPRFRVVEHLGESPGSLDTAIPESEETTRPL
jgi:hypothetical protein